MSESSSARQPTSLYNKTPFTLPPNCPIEHPDNFVTSFLVNGVLTTILVIAGVFGVVIELRALRIRAKHGRLAKYILVLCLWDVALLLSTCGFYGAVSLIEGYKPWAGWSTYLYKVFYPLINITMTGSVWTVVVVSGERYLALSQPLRQQTRSGKQVKWICLVIVVGSVVFCSMSFFELDILTCIATDTKELKSLISPSNLRQNELYILIYRVVCYLVIISPIPFVLVLTLTARTLCIRTKARRQWQSVKSEDSRRNRRGSGRSTRESRIALQLTTMIMKFLICYSAPTILNVIELLDKKAIITNTQSFTVCVDISNLLVVFHSATNWFIFYRWNKSECHRRPSTTNVSLGRRPSTAMASLLDNTQSRSVSLGLLPMQFINTPRPTPFPDRKVSNC